METLERAYDILYIAGLAVLGVCALGCLVRSILGPTIADRIVAVNMTGTVVINAIAMLSVLLGESYLGDICIIYAMLSFLAVIVLTKIYMGVYRERQRRRERRE